MSSLETKLAELKKQEETPPSNFPENLKDLAEEVAKTETERQETLRTSVKNDLDKISDNSTLDEKVETLKNLGKIDGEENFATEKTQLENLMEEIFKEDPLKCLAGIVSGIEENLKKNNLTTPELDNEVQRKYKDIKNIKI